MASGRGHERPTRRRLGRQALVPGDGDYAQRRRPCHHQPMANDRPTHASSLRAEPTRSVGLVLGAGGVAGWAWLVGCLAALEEEGGWDAPQADLIVGTSAGAGVAALLRGGRSASEQLFFNQEAATGSSVAAAAD